MHFGGVVLCGGDSRRMGRAKATLPFGDEPMLARVVRLLREVVEPVVVVAAPTQAIPSLPRAVRVIRDRTRGRGPLEGLYCGLSELQEQADAVYVTACDIPLLRTEFVRSMLNHLNDFDLVVPVEGKHFHPLAAVYRTQLVKAISKRLASDQLRLISFYEDVRTCRVDVETLRECDPDLLSLMNVNTPEDYQEVLQLAGFS